MFHRDFLSASFLLCVLVVAAPIAAAEERAPLWASPTVGKAVRLNHVPPQCAIVLAIRPADIVASEEGQRVLAALGPDFLAARREWEKESGVKLAGIKQLIVALHRHADDTLRPSFLVRLAKPIDKDELLGRWKITEKGEFLKTEYFATEGDRAHLIAEATDDGRVAAFLMADTADIKRAIKQGDVAPLVQRDFHLLLTNSDADRHFTAIFQAAALRHPATKELLGHRLKSLELLDWLVDDRLQSVMVSAHLGDQLFVETQVKPVLGEDAHAAVHRLQNQIKMLPTMAEDYLVSIDLDPYWRKLAFRFPQMLRTVYKQTRAGVEKDRAIVNCVLPQRAAHNLVAATELLMAHRDVPAELRDYLQTRIDLKLEFAPLDLALDDLVEAVNQKFRDRPTPFKIRINGRDLQSEGITKSAAIKRLDAKNRTAEQVLVQILRDFNPHRGVESASDVRQRLVYVIADDPDNKGKKLVLITTRNAAKKRGDKLPKPFRPPMREVQELLERPVDIAFKELSLADALVEVAKRVNRDLPKTAVPLRFAIRGADLRDVGASRIAPIINFKSSGRPVGLVVTDLLMIANPEVRPIDPGQERQKIVYVVERNPEDPAGKLTVLITTRRAAERKGYELPEQFVPRAEKVADAFGRAMSHRMRFIVADQPLAEVTQMLTARIRETFPELPFDFRIERSEAMDFGEELRIREFDQAGTLPELLTALLLAAAGDDSIKAPSDERLDFVYVTLDDKAADGDPVVLLTTRADVEKKGYELPEQFVSKEALARKPLEQLLASKINCTFKSKSLNDATLHVVLAANRNHKLLPLGYHIEIRVEDLKAEGVSVRQKLRDFQVLDKTLAEVLTAMLVAANPDKTVMNPGETQQKLVYVLEVQPDGDPQILITTRAAAQKRGDKLPPQFRPGGFE